MQLFLILTDPEETLPRIVNRMTLGRVAYVCCEKQISRGGEDFFYVAVSVVLENKWLFQKGRSE